MTYNLTAEAYRFIKSDHLGMTYRLTFPVPVSSYYFICQIPVSPYFICRIPVSPHNEYHHIILFAKFPYFRTTHPHSYSCFLAYMHLTRAVC